MATPPGAPHRHELVAPSAVIGDEGNPAHPGARQRVPESGRGEASMADDVLVNKAAPIEQHLDAFLQHRRALLLRDAGRGADPG
jgi:hypothetical protein